MASPSTYRPRKFSEILAAGETIVLDGALATHLETLGADLSTPLWSAHVLSTTPSLIQQTHLSYFTAGAQIATTASYQASIEGFTTHLAIPPAAATSLIEQSVALARSARDTYLASLSAAATAADATRSPHGDKKTPDLLIAGSVGPYATLLADGSEYTGSYTLSEPAFHAFHTPRIAALLRAGADVLAVETLPSYAETLALSNLLRTSFPEAEAWFSFTLRPDDATRIADGTPLATVLAAIEGNAGIVAVGVNCVGQGAAREAVREVRRCSRKSVVVYPNSGEVWDAEGRKWGGERVEGEGWRQWVSGVIADGAAVVGGCCRTGPGHIEVVAEVVGELDKTRQKDGAQGDT